LIPKPLKMLPRLHIQNRWPVFVLALLCRRQTMNRQMLSRFNLGTHPFSKEILTKLRLLSNFELDSVYVNCPSCPHEEPSVAIMEPVRHACWQPVPTTISVSPFPATIWCILTGNDFRRIVEEIDWPVKLTIAHIMNVGGEVSTDSASGLHGSNDALRSSAPVTGSSAQCAPESSLLAPSLRHSRSSTAPLFVTANRLMELIIHERAVTVLLPDSRQKTPGGGQKHPGRRQTGTTFSVVGVSLAYTSNLSSAR
jgi:hypothetical protein